MTALTFQSFTAVSGDSGKDGSSIENMSLR